MLKRSRLFSYYVLVFLLLNAGAFAQLDSRVSIVLASLPLVPMPSDEPIDAGEFLTQHISRQLSDEDELAFVTVAQSTKADFSTRLEILLTDALDVSAQQTHPQRGIILALTGNLWEQADAVIQAKQLAILSRMGQTFLQRGIKLYGVTMGTPPHTSFLLRLSAACNLDTAATGTYWFTAKNAEQLANAYARMLAELRQVDLSLYMKRNLSATHILLAAGIILMALTGMGALTWWFLPCEWLLALLWWRKPEEEVIPEETDILSEVDTVILGTVPESGDGAI